MDRQSEVARQRVVTVLDARVNPGRRGELMAAYADAIRSPDPGLVETWLLNDQGDPERWQIVAVWEDHEALDAMRAAGPPRGPAMFRAAGAEPILSVFVAAEHAVFGG